MTLEDYFIAAFLKNTAIDHAVRATVNTTEKKAVVTFYIHPHDKDGDTLDFRVDGNDLIPLR